MSANLENTVEPRPTGSRLDLINATATALSQHGLSSLTSAKIAGAAGLTAASINFHFGSKEALLIATLREVSEEYAEVIDAVLAEKGGDPLGSLLGIIDVSLSLQLSDARKVAVWYAFLAESSAREDYQRICGDRDAAFCEIVTQLCRDLLAQLPGGHLADADAVSLGLTGLIDQLWQGILFEGDRFDRDAARRRCRAYLRSVFPGLAGQIDPVEPIPSVSRAVAPGPSEATALKYTLPAWVYHSEEFHELEKEHLLLPNWQVVCHVSELPNAGDFVSFEFLGQRGFVVRDEAGTLRAFHNVCSPWLPGSAVTATSS
jgi:AcrR family transcriptional regulator